LTDLERPIYWGSDLKKSMAEKSRKDEDVDKEDSISKQGQASSCHDGLSQFQKHRHLTSN
ncbi:mCG58104, partial [Mus musculus]